MNGLALLPPSDATKMKKQTKITIASISIVVALLISLPVSLFVADAVTGDVYSKSYYAEWSKMYSRLKSTKGRKIVFLGNSAVAFGINSKLIQDELAADGLEYETVNFGLYGALGTKFMLDFSLNHIGKGDIVIVMPEEYPQSMSLYENPTENWKAFEGDRSAFGEVPYANKGSYIGAYIDYVVGKRAIAGKDNVTGVYALSSFGERCDMTFERKENEMLPYYRALGDDIVFDDSLFDPAFVSYLNAYGDKVKQQGGSSYFLLAPMNEKGIGASQSVASYYARLSETLKFPILGNPEDSVMEANWFYNTNFHLNSAGMDEFSLRVVSALKNEFSISSPLITPHPAMPELPIAADYVQGDDSDEALFEYEEAEGVGYNAISLLEEGKSRKSVVLPSMHEGKPVVGFAADVFAGNGTIEEITIQENVRMILDGSFKGCMNLRKVILKNTQPSLLLVGFHVLEGAEQLRFYVPKDALSTYILDYLWGRYAEYLEAY